MALHTWKAILVKEILVCWVGYGRIGLLLGN